MSNINDFVIENGELQKYKGQGGDVVIPEGVTSIGDCAFSGCSSLTSVVIPDGVTSIGNDAFWGCSSLTSVVIPDSVTSIGSHAFHRCESLYSIVIPESVTSIGDWAFYGCKSLTRVVIPDSVTSIGKRAFSSCKKLADADGFVIVRSVIYDYYGKGGDVVIPDGVTNIGNSAFSGCSSLKSIVIPDSVTSIGDEAFRDCSGLADADGFVIIRNVLYSYHGSDGAIVIPDGVTRIDDYAFWNRSSLTSVVIPDSVTSIGDSAFESCCSLSGIVIPDSVTSIGSHAFFGCESKKIQLPFAALNEEIFGRNGKTTVMTITRPGKPPVRVVASFRKWDNGGSGLMLPLDDEALPAYDRLIADGTYDGFVMNENGRIIASLLRLNETDRPIEEETRGRIIGFLASKYSKAIKFAGEDREPGYIRTLFEIGAVDETNIKRVTKALLKSEVPEIRAMAEEMKLV